MMNYEVGEVKRARDIGYTGTNWFAWLPCMDCNKERWVMLRGGKPISLRCLQCGVRLSNIKRRGANGGGYIWLHLSKTDPFYSMAGVRGRVQEHRLVMARQLNRSLERWELVHHKNGIKHDNRIENLELVTSSTHKLSYTSGYEVGYTQGFFDGQNHSMVKQKKESPPLRMS